MDVVRPCMLALGSLPLYLLLSFIVKLNDSHSLFEYVTLRVTPPPCFTVFNNHFWRPVPAFLRFSAPPDSHPTDKEANLTCGYFYVG